MGTRAKYTILSMMKDEGVSLVEWVAYHRHIGFDNICVYTNDCGDGTDEMLTRLEELGLVRHFRNPLRPGQKPQPAALNLATRNAAVMDSDWILVMDADEYLTIKPGAGRLDDLIATLPEASDGITITWRFFGSAGHDRFSTDLTTTRYLKAANADFRQGWGVKTLFRPFPGVRLGIHRPHMLDRREDPARISILIDQKWVNGAGEPVSRDFLLSGWRGNRKTRSYRLAEMHHYAVKSKEDFLLRRLRGNVNNKSNKYNADYFALFDRNEERRTAAADHADAVRALMTEILADPEMARLQARAHDFHQKNVETLRALPDYDSWMAELDSAAREDLDALNERTFVQSLPKDTRTRIEEMQADGQSRAAVEKEIGSVEKIRALSTREKMLADMNAAIDGGAPPGGTLHGRDFVPGEIVASETPKPLPPDAETEMARWRRRKPGSHKARKVVVATMKNEAPYLLEWVAHYRAAGFDDLLIYTNDCTDGTDAILDRLQELGLAQHRPNPLGPTRKDPQRSAYSRARKDPALEEAEWVLIADADEFINVRVGEGKVGDLIMACPEADAISLCWQLMGSSGARHLSETPVTQRFDRSANLEAPENGLVWGFKTLFRRKAFDYFGVHRPRFFKDRIIAPGYLSWVNGSGRDTGDKFFEKGWRFNSRTIGYDLGVMNHYAVKSREEFLLKRARGTANSKDKDRIDLDYWDKFDHNGCAAIPIAMTGMPDELDRLLADPELARLHRAAWDMARAGVARHLTDPALAAFVKADKTGAAA